VVEDCCDWLFVSSTLVASLRELPACAKVVAGFLPLPVAVDVACFELELESSCAAAFLAGGISRRSELALVISEQDVYFDSSTSEHPVPF